MTGRRMKEGQSSGESPQDHREIRQQSGPWGGGGDAGETEMLCRLKGASSFQKSH